MGLRSQLNKETRMSVKKEASLLYEVFDGIAYVTMNRPERLNAIDGDLAERMHAAWERFEADPAARVAILSGRGRAFCAGQDITPGALDESVPHQSHRAYPENGKKVFKPIVSAIHGHVAGAGFSLGIRGADITIAADTALITFPEPRSGVPVPPIQYQPYLPFKISMEFMLLAWRGGKPIDAQRAYHFGLVNAVVPEGEFVHPQVTSGNAREGLQAFLEKREPKFT
jgi:enoyl-CoA hydratase/carnithine racemase